jgi:hypothetical protein
VSDQLGHASLLLEPVYLSEDCSSKLRKTLGEADGRINAAPFSK